MVLLILTSICAVAFIIERGRALRWSNVIPPEIEREMEICSNSSDVETLRYHCSQKPSVFSRLLILAIDHLNLPKNENVDIMQTQARHEIVQLERGMVVLEIIVGIAPLLGLVGTIHGLITLFGDLSKAGLGDNAAFAKGIAIALNTTLMGLLIAIPSIIAWSYYTKKIESLTVSLERLCEEFLRTQYRKKKKG